MSESNSVPNGFRQIPGFPRYAVDEHGAVISVCGTRGGIKSWDKAKRLKPSTAKDGYRRICLWHEGREHTALVHKLVLLTFVGPCPDGMECRHLDGCKTNNHKDNLAWGTSSENKQDKALHGTKQCGEKANGVKLKTNDVLEIRRRAASGERRIDIAKDFQLGISSIHRIIHRKAWAHV